MNVLTLLCLIVGDLFAKICKKVPKSYTFWTKVFDRMINKALDLTVLAILKAHAK